MPRREINKHFNLDELEKSWEEWFDDWMPNTLTMTQFEEKLMTDWTAGCLPRHMRPHDWNLPFAEGLLLQLRRNIAGIMDEL